MDLAFGAGNWNLLFWENIDFSLLNFFFERQITKYVFYDITVDASNLALNAHIQNLMANLDWFMTAGVKVFLNFKLDSSDVPFIVPAPTNLDWIRDVTIDPAAGPSDLLVAPKKTGHPIFTSPGVGQQIFLRAGTPTGTGGMSLPISGVHVVTSLLNTTDGRPVLAEFRGFTQQVLLKGGSAPPLSGVLLIGTLAPAHTHADPVRALNLFSAIHKYQIACGDGVFDAASENCTECEYSD